MNSALLWSVVLVASAKAISRGVNANEVEMPCRRVARTARKTSMPKAMHMFQSPEYWCKGLDDWGVGSRGAFSIAGTLSSQSS
eukprot:747050-Amphidinium_carterae.1